MKMTQPQAQLMADLMTEAAALIDDLLARPRTNNRQLVWAAAAAIRRAMWHEMARMATKGGKTRKTPRTASENETIGRRALAKAYALLEA